MNIRILKKHTRFSRALSLLAVFGVMIFLVAGCASSTPEAVGVYTSEDTQAKNLTPPDGKGLVYFFYGPTYLWGNPEISLNGATSLINSKMYILWELPPGSYRINASMPGQSIVPKTASYPVEVQSGSVTYYRILSYVEEESSNSKNVLYKFAPMKNSEAKAYVDAYTLVSWFRDGQRIYYDDSRLRKPQPVEAY